MSESHYRKILNLELFRYCHALHLYYTLAERLKIMKERKILKSVRD